MSVRNPTVYDNRKCERCGKEEWQAGLLKPQLVYYCFRCALNELWSRCKGNPKAIFNTFGNND